MLPVSARYSLSRMGFDDSMLARFGSVPARRPKASRSPESRMCEGVLDCNDVVASRCTIQSATKRIPRADTNRVVVVSRMRNNRDVLWVLSERRMNSVGAMYTEPAISRTIGVRTGRRQIF